MKGPEWLGTVAAIVVAAAVIVGALTHDRAWIVIAAGLLQSGLTVGWIRTSLEQRRRAEQAERQLQRRNSPCTG